MSRKRLCDFCNREVAFKWKIGLNLYEDKGLRKEMTFLFDVCPNCIKKTLGEKRTALIMAEMKSRINKSDMEDK